MQPKTDDYPLSFVIKFKSLPADGDLDKTATAALSQIEAKGTTHRRSKPASYWE